MDRYIYWYCFFNLMVKSKERIFKRITRRMSNFPNTSRSLYVSFVHFERTLAYAFDTFTYGEARIWF